MGGAASIAYGANLFIKVTPATEDHIGSQSCPSACNTVNYVLYSFKSRLSKGLKELIIVLDQVFSRKPRMSKYEVILYYKK